MACDINLFDGLVAVVRYRRKEGYDVWHTMAAYDSRDIADQYAAECSKGERPWEYQVFDIPALTSAM